MTAHHDSVRIGVLGLSLDLYQRAIPEAIPGYETFHKTLVEKLAAFGTVVSDRLCYTRDEVETLVQHAENAGADVLVIIFQSYHPSLNTLGAILRTRLPLLIWNTQRLREIGPAYSPTDMIENHGMHGVQDLCNCLCRSGRRFGLISGHFENAAHLEDVESWLRLLAAVQFCRRMKVGILGRPFQGMGDFGVDETRMLAEWGPSVESLTLAELAETQNAVSAEELAAEMAVDRSLFDFSPDIEEEDHRRSARLSIAIRRIVEKHGVHAITQHFGVYGEDPRIETCPFLAFNHLIASGCGYAGEGNVTIAALDAMLTRVFGRSAFCEMFTADFTNDRVLFYHMAEGNYSMARKTSRPLLKKVPYTFGDGKPYLAPVFQYEPGPATFVNLTTDPSGAFYMLAFQADITDYERVDALTAPHFLAQIKRPLGEFLDAYGCNGGTHHLSFVEGYKAREITRLGQMLGMPVRTI